MQQQIDLTLDQIEHSKLVPQEFPGAVTFLILDLVYKIDFLVNPEGIIKESLLYCHELFFDDATTAIYDKNRMMLQRIRQMKALTIDEVSKQLYNVNSTFGTSKPEGNQMVMTIIEAQQKDLSWYSNNHPEPYTQAICGYIVGYSLHAYALPAPMKSLLIFYYKVIYDEFFAQLGFSPRYSLGSNKSDIKPRLMQIVKEWNETAYPDLTLDVKLLNVDSKHSFALTYVQMLTTLK
jgi:hypothetical protein